MTLDEAIKHAEEVADLCEDSISTYDMSDPYESHLACQNGKCAEEHRQLAEWLKELKDYKDQNGDTIYRQAAIRIASGYCHPANIAKELERLPSAQQRTKTGHWIMPRNDDGMSDPIEYQVRCSGCGFGFDPQTWHMELHKYGGDKYCPYCGAKMVKPHESEE